MKNPKMKDLVRCVLLGVSALLLAACSNEGEPTTKPTVDIAAGRNIAAASCIDCHGMDGQGAKDTIPNLAAQPAGYLAESLHAYREGRRHHAALESLTSGMSDEDIRNIAGYYSSLPALPIADTTLAPTADGSFYHEGEQVASVCAECHGANGYSQEPGIPSLAGQQPAYLVVSTQEYAQGSRGHVEKEAMLQGLAQVDIEKMAMYFAAQLPPVREPSPFGDVQRGERFSMDCGECHGARGISQNPLVPSLAGQEPVYLVNAIKSYRDHQRQHDDMIADNSDSEIEDIAAYYSVQQTEAAADERMELPEMVASCDRCHGPALGESRMGGIPALSGQNREYLVRAMQTYREDDRDSSLMHRMSAHYSDETIEALASYYASLPAN
jgi:cytochrome c553